MKELTELLKDLKQQGLVEDYNPEAATLGVQQLGLATDLRMLPGDSLWRLTEKGRGALKK